MSTFPSNPPHAGHYPPHPTRPPVPLDRPARRSFFEFLLDPRTIQWLLASGGLLLVAGLVIWLASLGVFDNPLVVAAAMGAGTLGMLAGGWAVLLRTRHHLAGRAMTLLACLVMPLNLWFYHSYELVTLEGHLWLAGVACCALYAASAWVLKDALFVYVLTGGVAMTGLLTLADVHRFAEIAAPSTLLVTLGLVCLHVERAFSADGDGPFTRKRFGLAFFWSAQALLGGGLLILAGAQFVGWIYNPLLKGFLAAPPQIAVDPSLRWWALGLIAAGVYAYVYSDLVVRRVGTYIYIAAGLLLWGEVVAVDLFNVGARPTALILALALTGLAANVLQNVLSRKVAFTRHAPPLGLALNLLAVVIGVGMYLRAANPLFHAEWPFDLSPAFAVAMLVAAGASRYGASLHRGTMPRVSAAYLFASAAGTVVAAASMLALAGIETWIARAPLLMLIPIGYLAASRVHRDGALGRPLAFVAQATAASLVALTAFVVVHNAAVRLPLVLANPNFSVFCLATAGFYAISACLGQRARDVYLAAALTCAALASALHLTDFSTGACVLAFAGLGLATLIVNRVILRRKTAVPSTVLAVSYAGNAIVSLAVVAQLLVGLSRLVVRTGSFTFGSHAAIVGVALAAALVVADKGLRRWYVVMAVALLALLGVHFQIRLNLTLWQKAELLAVGIGLAAIVAGHAKLLRRDDSGPDFDETASGAMFAGSLLAGIPLLAAVIVHRLGGQLSTVDEFALMTLGIGLLVSGVLFRVKSTTLVGGALLALHVALMLVFIGMRAQLALGVYLAAGGATVFGAGLLLSIHRDRLAALPQRIRDREGVFKVLNWR